MPPKKTSAPAPSKKAEQKKKEKVIEDKTFGLKNKKGAKTQKFIEHVNKQIKGDPNKKINPLAPISKKEDKKKEQEELNQLFKPVATQKAPPGVDPKSLLCMFFKQGQCTKGDKCKFSHDLTIERKSQKINVYVDMRDNEDNMENWDEEKLKEVVAKKHGEREKKLPPTDIICKHFIDALESNKYGWFWECPNGGDKCHYRHALPPGFVLNKDKKKHDKKDDITIEELVEIERAKLGFELPRITFESFIEWKKKKIKERQENDQKEHDRKRAEFKAGKNIGLSGREMFTFNPELANDEDMEEGEEAFVIERENDEDLELYREITTESLYGQAENNPGSATQVTKREFNLPISENNHLSACGGVDDESCLVVDSAPIDEALFADDDDDLDELEDELNTLQVN